MDGLAPGLLFAAFAALVILLMIAAAAHARKRREALAALAARRGWTFDPHPDRAHDERYPQFPIFGRGHGRAAYNRLAGNLEIAGRRFAVRAGDFQYRVTSSHGKHRRTTTYRFSYLILHLPWGATPELRIRPEGLLDKIAGALGFDDIDFESSEFSRRFHVKCRDKRFAYDVISPRMMELLMEGGPVALEVDGGCCCVSDGGRCWDPEAFDANVSFAAAFFERWPPYLVEQLEARAAVERRTA